MDLVKRTLLLISFLFLFSVGVAFAQNTYLSDYNFQLDQYRRNYAEYLNFKKDYDGRPTLNNEQKALLSARQTIVARELAWANFYLALSESISQTGVNYSLTAKSVTDLANIAKYHFGQADNAKNIVTRADLTSYTKAELKILAVERQSTIQAQVANKLGELIKIQVEAKKAYDTLLPQLELVKNEISVKNGLDQIQIYSSQITAAIEELSTKTTNFNLNEGNQDQFYQDSSEALKVIRNLQNRLASVIIDLDTNYVRR